MIQYRFQPLGAWPRASTPDHERKNRPFIVSGKRVGDGAGGTRYVPAKPTPLTQTYEDLRKELRHLGVTGDVVLQIGLRESDIRITDNLPRSNAPRPKHPGVIVSFDAVVAGRKTPLKFMCDHCKAWEDNLRAITLTLERLRLADLYGVTKSGEQYRGWAALPPAGGLVTPVAMTVDEAARFIATRAGSRFGASDRIISDADTFRAAYREGARRDHPDANRGVVSENWQRLQEARQLLEAHHAGKGAP